MANFVAGPPAVPIEFSDSKLDVSSLNNRSVLITGGAAGIGLACAAKLAEAGARLTIADLQETVGQEVAQDLCSKGHKVQFVCCDVTSYDAQVAMFQKAIEFGRGKLDVVIPNAGVMREKNLFDMVGSTSSVDGPPPPEPGYLGCDINLQAVYNTCYLAMHYFRLPRGDDDAYKPSIVLIASLAGYIGYPSSSTYSMSKFGVRGLFYGIRDRATRETPPVRVNLVAPCFIDTAMTRRTEFVESEAGGMAKIMGFVPMENVTTAIMQFAADQRLHGRAAGLFPNASEDLGDDIEGAFGGPVLQKHMSGILADLVKAMTAMAAEKNELSRQDSATAPTQVSGV
ncbi:hypothetical protein DE146DRAFT_388087 [Phaeosphaeria sp. MPI-PUGE-AT-0046c]|nr:hypothetical protein DE146DRAFT_388087 [Phaeosphaeria sp. MPI-PUGE-AT-0046c]